MSDWTISVIPDPSQPKELKGTTLFVEEPPSRGGHRTISVHKGHITPTAVYIAGNHAKSANLNVILWFHGWYVQDYWNDIFVKDQNDGKTMLRQSVDEAGQDVVLIAPWLGYQDKNGGELVAPYFGEQGVGFYLQALLGELRDAGALDTITVDRLVIACHSGSGQIMMNACDELSSDTWWFKDQLKECWGFDCMYNDYRHWIEKHHTKRSLFFYLGDGSGYQNKSPHTNFRDLWTYAYGTPSNPRQPLMDKVYLAPATKQPLCLEIFSDNQVFDTYDQLSTKDAKLLVYYERWRKDTLDPLLDNKSTEWEDLVHRSVKNHYVVVQDLVTPRIADMLNDNKLAGAGKIIAQCKAPPPPPPAANQKSTPATAGKKR
jgi:hypothetical protein